LHHPANPATPTTVADPAEHNMADHGGHHGRDRRPSGSGPVEPPDRTPVRQRRCVRCPHIKAGMGVPDPTHPAPIMLHPAGPGPAAW
jgi:hypothetical protein